MVIARHIWLTFLSALLVLASMGCKPDVKGRASVIDSDRVLAVRSVPAEAAADEAVGYEALYVGPDGDADSSKLQWAFCNERKPLAESGPVSSSCLAAKGKALAQLGKGNMVMGQIPTDVCEVFGPLTPTVADDQPEIRAADPDITGGYYQPVRIRLDDDDNFVGVTRLNCGLSSVSQEQALDFAQRYRVNENPLLDSVTVRRGGKQLAELSSDPKAAAVHIAKGDTVTLRASWASCPLKAKCGDGVCGALEDTGTCEADCTEPKGCTGSEPYVELNPQKHAVESRREAMRVSWFSTDGDFEHDRTGRTEDDADTTYSDDDWTAPEMSGQVLLWVVLRDDRGGVGFASFKLDVH